MILRSFFSQFWPKTCSKPAIFVHDISFTGRLLKSLLLISSSCWDHQISLAIFGHMFVIFGLHQIRPDSILVICNIKKFKIFELIIILDYDWFYFQSGNLVLITLNSKVAPFSSFKHSTTATNQNAIKFASRNFTPKLKNFSKSSPKIWKFLKIFLISKLKFDWDFRNISFSHLTANQKTLWII